MTPDAPEQIRLALAMLRLRVVVLQLGLLAKAARVVEEQRDRDAGTARTIGRITHESQA